MCSLKLLADLFAIDIAAYAVMSNHYHVVLHVDAARGARMVRRELIWRWTRLYQGSLLLQRTFIPDSAPVAICNDCGLNYFHAKILSCSVEHTSLITQGT